MDERDVRMLEKPASAQQRIDNPPEATAWPAVSVAMVGTFMALLDVFIVLIAAPAIQKDLGASDAQVEFVLAVYQLVYAVTLITGGRLGDLYGRRRLFQIGMALFTVASLLCGMASGCDQLIAARAVQGFGAALMFPQVFTMIQVLMPGPQRHRAFGVLGAVIGLSTITGQVFGGLLINADLFGTSWRPVFWINVPIGVVTLVLASRLIPETKAPMARRLDLPGVATLTVALTLLVVPLIEGRQAGWPAWTWACVAASLGAFVAFILVERAVQRRGLPPLVEMDLFRQRPFTVGVLMILAYFAAMNSFFLVLSLTMQSGLGLTAFQSGLVYAPLAVVFFGSSLLAGRLAPRLGRRVLELGGALTVAGFLATVLLAWNTGSRLSPVMVAATMVVQGLGEGLLQTPLINAVLSRIRSQSVGLASGVLSTAQQVGGMLGVAVMGVVYFGALHGAGQQDASAYSNAFAFATIFNALSVAVCTALVFLLPRTTEETR